LKFKVHSPAELMQAVARRCVVRGIAALPILLGHLTEAAFATSAAGGADSKVIRAIEVAGTAVAVFEHARDQQEPGNFPDAQVTAWKEADGTVNLMIPNAEAYRMRGPDLEHLKMDPHKIYSSARSARETGEDRHNYAHWLMGPYSLDGRHFYTLAHSEWYACLLTRNCDRTAANHQSVELNSWANTINSFASADGGASWHLNVISGNHVVAAAAYHWSGSPALARQIYLQSTNHTGLLQPTRVIREGAFFYSISYYLQRDFGKLDARNAGTEAPVDRSGYVLLRTGDIANPNGWQGWTGGSGFAPISSRTLATFRPEIRGVAQEGAPPQIIYDENAHCYILIFTLFGNRNPLYFMTTTTLQAPHWSAAAPIAGSERLVTDPARGTRGFNDTNYPSIADPGSAGFNFEFTRGTPLLFFSTFEVGSGASNSARDLYRVRLSVQYN
jgi:hypothetical protein